MPLSFIVWRNTRWALGASPTFPNPKLNNIFNCPKRIITNPKRPFTQAGLIQPQVPTAIDSGHLSKDFSAIVNKK